MAQNGIGHAFGGAIALAYHVYRPRSTNDIDVNVAVAADHAAEVMRALPPQVRWDSRAVRMAEVEGEVKLRWLREGPVDLFFALGPYYQLVEERKVLRPLRGVEIPVLSATDLVVFKTGFGRDKDWIDILAMLQAGTPDVSEALRCAEDLYGSAARHRLEEVVSRFERGDPLVGNDPNIPRRPDSPSIG